jgi:histidine kinase
MPERTESPRPMPRVVAAPEPGGLVTERVRLVRELARGGMGSVWVARHLTLDVDVAVKFLLLDDPVRRERLSREAQLAARVDHPHAVRVFDHGLTPDGLPFLVMELLDGESLAERLERAGALTLAEVRRLVAQLGGALEAAHRAGVVHRDVKPSNVVLSRQSDGLWAKLVDFGIARPVYGGEDTLTGAGHVVGTTLYLAPEQLIDGLPPDHRADLWGLAVVAYEALTRRRPYGGTSAASVGAAMVLRRCEPVTSLDASLPSALDGWFERALHLEPRERHANAAELAASFEAAATSVTTGPLRRASPVFRVSDRVRGRDRELGVLEEAWRTVTAPGGRSRLVAISGWSGVGKTALVEELRLRLRSGPAVVVGGKFDQFERGVPYQGLIPALRELVRRTLAQPEAERWRARVADRVGDTGQVLVELVDEMTDLLGPQPQWPDGSPTERRNQLHVALGRLVDGLAAPERPLLVYLDDLQWADLATLDLLAALATDPAARPVLLLGVYRSNEVGPAHPLALTLDRIRRANALDELPVGPLSEDAVLDIVSETFPDSPGRMRLATTLHRKTHGNAFFLRRLLESLVDARVIAFDHTASQWRWDQSAVDATELSDDVVAFVGAELGRMPALAREAIAVAACIGDAFPLDLVARALSVDASTALDRLGPAMATELVSAAGRSSSSAAPSGELVFRFVHDRVRQAARGLLSADEAAGVHRRVGRYLLDHLQGAERERRLFELVEHLNRGFVGGVADDERPQLLALNLQAARRAVRSAAFAAGHVFFTVALRHLGPEGWNTDPALALALHVEGARAAWLAGSPDQMETLVATAVAHARTPLDRTLAHEVRMQGLLSQQRFLEALALAVEVLGSLGLEVPSAATAGDAGAAVGDTLQRLAAFGEADLDALPNCADPLVQARQRIQIGAMSSAYMAAPNLLPILACNIVRATLEHGTGKESPYGFAALGLVLVAVNLIDAAYANGRIAADMLDRVGDRSIRPRVLHVLGAHVRLFVDPLRDSIDAERQVARLGMDVGDLEYAAWGLHVEVCNGFYAGVELGALSRSTTRNLEALAHHQQLAAHGCTVQYGLALARLTGAPDPEGADEAALLDAHRAANFRGAVFITTVIGTFLRYLLGDPAEATAFADAGAPYADGAVATYHLVWWHQLRALSHLGARGAAAAPDIEGNLQQLRLWQRASPANHDHRVHLVEGELARVLGRTERALAHFDEAVASAAANGFLHEEALAHELAARCDTGNRTSRLERARAGYARWGATRKIGRLDSELEGRRTTG